MNESDRQSCDLIRREMLSLGCTWITDYPDEEIRDAVLLFAKMGARLVVSAKEAAEAFGRLSSHDPWRTPEAK